MPAVSDLLMAVPDIGDTVPGLVMAVPDIGDAVPVLTVPDIGNAVPDLVMAVPDIGDAVQDLRTPRNVEKRKKKETRAPIHKIIKAPPHLPILGWAPAPMPPSPHTFRIARCDHHKQQILT